MPPEPTLPDPDSLKCFLAAARRLNFRSAAAAVHLTPAALGKRIQQLERTLGVELFRRTTRRVDLTQAGLALIPVAEGALDELRACARAARGETGPPEQEVTIGTRHELGLSWLLPQVGPLEKRYPHLKINLYFSSGPDLELRVRSGEIDCAVTSRRTDDPRLDAYRLLQEDYAFVAHPKLLARHPFRETEHAAAHTLIDAHASLPLFGYWRGAPGGRSMSFGEVRIMGTIAAIRWLVKRKQGVAVLPRYLIQGDLEAGRLSELFPEVEPLADHFRLQFRSEDPRRSTYDALATAMRAEPLK